MASGDVVFTDQFCVDVLEGLHDLENDPIKIGLVTSSTTPTAATADPRWGAGGTTDWSTNEVTPGGNYSAGGASVANPTVTLSGGAGVFDGDDVSITQNGSNPTNARWGILYNAVVDASPQTFRVLGYVDLGTDIDLSAGDFTITWNASGIASLDQA
jgi:hypothetical protein